MVDLTKYNKSSNPDILSLLTKLTVVIYSTDVHTSSLENQSYMDEIHGVVHRMMDEGKTDGGRWVSEGSSSGDENDQLIVYRRWIDQTVAEEWLANLQTVHNKYQIPVISTDIINYNTP